ncbi:MAG: glycosyltransferase family 39 protein [Candidatus Hydrothermarchaeales archaeon]
MKNSHKAFLVGIYVLGLIIRLYPRLEIDPHLLTFQGDIWYRLAMSQYIVDNLALPNPDLRYLVYGRVPMWYPPLGPVFLAALSRFSGLDLPTVSSRITPFIEALSPLSIFFLAKHLYDDFAGYVSALVLALTPTFVFWTGITDPQSFTLFFIPLYILLWLRHSKAPDRKNIALLGVLLALNFLVHLSYFVAVLVLFSVTFALVIGKDAGKWLFRDLAFAVVLSQVLTIYWWLPDNLYFWWIKSLVTSSGLYSATWQIGDYGIVAAALGAAGFIYLAVRREKWTPLLFLWALPIFIESQNEAILFAIHRVDLTWTTLAKPLEGFRFFPYLAQPASIAVGAFFSWAGGKGDFKNVPRKRVQAFLVLLVAAPMLWGLVSHYQVDAKFQTSGLTTAEYRAAEWYRANSRGSSLIAADYYRAQMLSGVSGGKALDGGMFPLRNVDIPYISVPAVVQDDLYILYNTSDPKTAHDITKKYGLTHIFYSKNMERYGNLLSNYRPASQYGVPIDLDKFSEPEYFKLAYEDKSSGVKIFEVVE